MDLAAAVGVADAIATECDAPDDVEIKWPTTYCSAA